MSYYEVFNVSVDTCDGPARFDNAFYEGREDPNTTMTINWPSLARQRNAI